MGSINQIAAKLGVKKSRELIASEARENMKNPNHRGRLFQFPKGQVPVNKGKKMPGWGPRRMKETQFKKGQTPRKWMPVGATRRIEGFWYRKISDVRKVPYTVNWKPCHVLLWEEKHGPVPAGHVVAFKDGNREHIEDSNLELLSRRELMLRNTVHNLPQPLVQVIMLNGALKRKLRRLDRAQEQDVRPA